MTIRLFTLGGLRAADDGEELHWLGSQWVRAALLVHIALERVATRDALQALLWPECDADTAAHRLNQTLYALRRSLGQDCIETHGRDLRAADRLEADALEFERAVEAGDAVSALALYRGSFLQGVHLASTNEFQSWVDARRAKYARLFRQASRASVEACHARGDVAAAVAAAHAWVAPDPLDDEAQHRLIELLALSGDRVQALKQYGAYAKLLEAEDLEPLEQTRALVTQLESATVAYPALEGGRPARGSEPTVAVSRTEAPAFAASGWPLHTAPPAAPSTWLHKRGQSGRDRFVVLAAAAVILVVLATMFPRRAPTGGVASVSRATVMAIRPFREAGGSDLGWLAAALETRLAAALVGAPDLEVRSTVAVAALGSHNVRTDSLARLLGIDYLVDGHIIHSGDSITVNAELVAATNGTLMAIGSVRQPVHTRPEQLLGAVWSEVEQVLLPAIGGKVREAQWRAGTRDTLAIVLRYRAQQRRWAGEAMLQVDAPAAAREFAAADSLLAASIRRDPRWAEPRKARAVLAARRALAHLGDTARVRAVLDEGLAQVEAVLASEPASTEALALRGRLLWRRYLWTARSPDSDRMLDVAQADLDRAARAPAPIAMAAQDLSEILYMSRSSFAEARHYARIAYDLDAYLDEASLLINRLALTALNLGDDADAAHWCRTGLRRYPEAFYHLACMLEVMAWGNLEPVPDSARTYFRALVQRNPSASVRWHYLLRVAAVDARAGRHADALQALERVRAEANDAGAQALRMNLLPWEAGVLFRMGRDADALRLFEQYLEYAPKDAAVRAHGFPLRGYLPPAPGPP